MDLIAINVLIDPDAKTIERARAINAQLRSNFPPGFALDADHAPHVTLVQSFVRRSELPDVTRAVRAALKGMPPLNWVSQAVGYYALTHEMLALMGIVIEPTAELRQVQGELVSALAAYVVTPGTPEAFAPRVDGQAIGQPTIDYVENFIGPRTGENYNPHLTVGICNGDFVDTMKAEPFKPFPVRPVSVSLYQLGDFGTARRRLDELHRL